MSKVDQHSRRSFLIRVGEGMLVAGMGPAISHELGFFPNKLAWAEEQTSQRITFGIQEQLVSLMQETPADKLLPQLVSMYRSGTSLKDLTSAAALANARAFGGEDYIGFHTFMAFMPALAMSGHLPTDRQALPVLKVIYRNAARLQESGNASSDTLHTAHAAEMNTGFTQALNDAVHARDLGTAEGALLAAGEAELGEAWNALLPTVHEAPEVHRIVLAHRAWDMRNLVGTEYALTMLRQSVHYCVKNQEYVSRNFGGVPELVGRLLEQYKLLDPRENKRTMDDAWVSNLAQGLLKMSGEDGAEAIASAIAEGVSLETVGEVLSQAANQMVLRDEGRPEKWAQENKPKGSVHGDSMGVHASDSVNAWRHISRVSNPRNTIASLILGGYHIASDCSRYGHFSEWQPRPYAEHMERVTEADPVQLVSGLRDAITMGDQAHAIAVTGKYLSLGHAPEPVFSTLLDFALSQDGALHAEKYFWTVRDEYLNTRPSLRNNQLLGLARVTASCHGYPAPGYADACQLLGCDV